MGGFMKFEVLTDRLELRVLNKHDAEQVLDFYIRIKKKIQKKE